MEVLATFHILKMPPSWSRRDMILFLLQEEMIQMSYTTFSLHLALYDWEFVQTLDYEALEMYQPLVFPQQTRWCNINQEPHYHSKRSKASTLRSPALGYIHALLCKTLTWRRKSMTTVSVADFLYLCAMTEHLLLSLWQAIYQLVLHQASDALHEKQEKEIEFSVVDNKLSIAIKI